MSKYIIFDTETTGNGEDDRIVQVGALLIHGKNQVEVFDELCKAPKNIAYEAMEVHNITPEMIGDKPDYAQTSFAKMIEEHNDPSNFLIAHNISFDLEMLSREGFQNHYTIIDTLRCAKHLLNGLPHHRLQYLRYALGLYKLEEVEAQRLGVNIKAHDAIGDVVIVKLLLRVLMERAKKRFEDENPIAALVRLTQTPVLMESFKFGKYKDKKIEEVASTDMGYLLWMRQNLQLDEDMIYSLDYYLN